MPQTAGSGPQCSARVGRRPTVFWSSSRSADPAPSLRHSRQLLKQLAEIVGAGTSPLRSAVSSTRSQPRNVTTGRRATSRDRLILNWPAASGDRAVRSRRIQRSEARGYPGRSPDPAGSSNHRSTPQTPEPARLEAIDVLSVDRPGGSRAGPTDLLEPRQPLAVQIAAVRALAEGHSADVADLLLPRLRAVRAGGPRGRGPDASQPRTTGPRPCCRPARACRPSRISPSVDRASRSRTALEAPRPRDRAAGASRSSDSAIPGSRLR